MFRATETLKLRKKTILKLTSPSIQTTNQISNFTTQLMKKSQRRHLDKTANFLIFVFLHNN